MGAETIGTLALEAVGVESFTLFSLGATNVSLATAVGTTIIVAGTVGANLLINRPTAPGASPGLPALPPPEGGHQALRQAIPPRIVGLGRNRLGGSYVLYEAKDGTSYDVIAFHHGKIFGVVGIYLHDDVVTLGLTGLVDELGDGRYAGGSIGITFNGLGEPTETALGAITAVLPTIWTSAHRGDSIAAFAMTCAAIANPETFTQVFPRGHPEPSIVADCTPIWDWRDETQDPDDETTWLASTNAVVQLAWYLTDEDRGMGLDWDTLIEPVLDKLTIRANRCDELVEKADGSFEKRYESNGFYSLDADHADVIKSILDTCDGWIAENGDGSLAMEVGVYVAPTEPIESAHVKGWSLQKGVADEEVVNELTLNYTERSLDYKTAPGQPWRDEASIAELGRVRSQLMSLPWVHSHSQGRRLAKRKMAQLQSALRGTLTTTLYGARFLGERWIPVQVPECADLSDVVIENRGMSIDLLNNEVTINFVVINPNTIDAWDADTEEGSPPTVAEKLISIPPPVPTGLTAAARGSVGPGEGVIYVESDYLGRSDLEFQSAWRINGSGSPFTNDPQTAFEMFGGRMRWIGGIGMTPGHTYEVKARSFAPTGSGSAFSSSTTVAI